MNRTDKLLITGAAGLVGQNLIVHLKSAGYTNLVALDKHPANTRILRELHPDIEVMTADLSRPGDWEQSMKGVAALVILHAQIGGLHEKLFIANNVTGQARTLPTRIHLVKSMVSILQMLSTEAPRIFRVPISLVFCWIIKSDKPKMPIDAMNMVRKVKSCTSLPNRKSSR